MSDKKGTLDIGIAVDLIKVAEGQLLKLKDGRVGKVTENMNDGQWVEMSFPDDDPELDELELVYSQDIHGIVEKG
ncbi:MAG: hypothetical protein KUG62_00630 [Rhodobacteraceae bacterium]|nr:hypothetical protein [Paracoccaceae bacterium]